MKALDDLVPGLRASPFSWTEDVRRSLLHLLVTDRTFFSAHKDGMKPDFFPDRVHQEIFRIAKHCFDEFGVLPSQVVAHDELKRTYAKRASEWPVSETEFFAIYDYREAVADSDFLGQKLAKYIRREAYKDALVRSYEALVGEDIDELDVDTNIESILKSALSVGVAGTKVIDYFDEIEARYEEKIKRRDRGSVDRSPTGFASFDRENGGGIGRKEILTILGDSGVGKSFLLNHIALENVIAGYNVLYITLENSQEVAQDRMDACFTQIPMRELLNEAQTKTLPKLRQFRDMYRNRLKVIELEEGSCLIPQIRAMVEMEQVRTGWKADVIILDYLDELKRYPNTSSEYDSQGMNLREFRGWMKSIKAFGYTATQANRGAATTSTTGRNEIGDSYWKLRRSDYMISISVTSEEEEKGLAHLFIVKSRNSRSGYPIYLERELSRARFKEIEQDEYDRRIAARRVSAGSAPATTTTKKGSK
jgi:KaiC/GvpD/RAD55 family RecA-like ATPase